MSDRTGENHIVDQRPFSAAAFNQYLSENKLMASRCTSCGAISLPPHVFCPTCHQDQMEWFEVSGKGKLAAFTVIYIGPMFMAEEGYGRDKPYVSGIVELDEGVKISSRITGIDASRPESIEIGMPVTVDFVHVGEGEKAKTYLAFFPM